jgi:peptide/nickel transport system substrate-binding protein
MEDTGAYLWINHEPETFIYRDDLAIDVYPSGEMDIRDFRSA